MKGRSTQKSCAMSVEHYRTQLQPRPKVSQEKVAFCRLETTFAKSCIEGYLKEVLARFRLKSKDRALCLG